MLYVEKRVTVEVESTGVPGLDEVTGGLPPYGLTILLGPPGSGKTALTLQMAMYHARAGRDVVFLSIFSEPHEKVIDHMRGFSFFDETLIGERIEMVSLTSTLAEGATATTELILRTARTKNRPLIVLDGYRGLRNVVPVAGAQELLARLSAQLPYLRGSCLVSSESSPKEEDQFSELSAGDAILALHHTRHGTWASRFLEVLKVRGHRYRDGLHGMRIGEDGIEVFPRLATVLPDDIPVPTGRRVRFDLPQFDEMMGGGPPQYSTTGIVGGPGTGKTTLAFHFMLAGAKAGEKGLFITFHEVEVDLIRKAADLGLDLASAVDTGMVQIMRVPPVEANPDVLAWRIRSRVEEAGIQRIVVDGVEELEQTARALGSSNFYLASLTEYFRRSGATALLLEDEGHVLARNDPSFAVWPLAQNRVLLRRVEYQGAFYRVCSVLSMQASDHDSSLHEFVIGWGGVRILNPESTRPGVLAAIAQEHPINGD